jgi:hypothetical protein
MPIDLDRLPQQSLHDKLYSYILMNNPQAMSVVHNLPVPEKQEGQTCKLCALSYSMRHAARLHNSRVVALYKKHQYTTSLRQIAKQLGSVVGEMYSIESLLGTCQQAGYDAEFYAPNREEEYITQLENLVNQNLAPMVFFDLERTSKNRNGQPMIGTGVNEHAATVVGYYRTKYDETHFIVTQWGFFYDLNGMELALSSFNSLSDSRDEEVFIKMRTRGNVKGRWHDIRDVKNYEQLDLELLSSEGIPVRRSKRLKDNETPLKGKIMVVTGPNARLRAASTMTASTQGFFSNSHQEELSEVAKNVLK